MINFFVLLTLSALYAAPAKIPPCGKKVMAYSEYDDIERGREVQKHSIFEVPDWSADSTFDGLLVKKSEAIDAQLRISVDPIGKNEKPHSKEFSLQLWPRDPNYFFAKGLETRELLDDTRGTYKIGLLKGQKVQCEDQYEFSSEGAEE